MPSGLQDGNIIIAIMSAYLMGFVACFTPCVYPLIPITLSILGASGETNKRKAFLLSFCYVLGIAATYTLLGIVTVRLGMVFGSMLGSPALVIPMCAILVLLALHTLGVLELPLGALQSRASTVGGKGYGGAFLMGGVSGGVAAPCVGPILAILLVEVAKSQDTFRAVGMLLGYSLGLGTPFLVLGTFSSMLSSLPKSGNWLHYVKYLIAICILAEVIFLLTPILPEGFIPSANFLVSTFLIVLVAPFAYRAIRKELKAQQLVTSSLLAFAVLQIVIPPHASLSNGVAVEWLEDDTAALAKGRSEGRPVMVDLSARWCVACKELEHTFSDARVARQIREKLVPVRIDFTSDTPKTEEITERYGVVGLPCVLFVNSDGEEIENSRITGKVSPEELLAHFDKVQASL